jgi:sirohydrochlorin ferrochelatase
VVLVDHGSKKPKANASILDLRRNYLGALAGAEGGGGGEGEGGLWGALRRLAGKGPIVEVAHMELADPSIEEAFGRCVRRGARSVVVAPFFLAPGRHVTQDLPELTREASERHGGAPWAVAEAIGPDPMVAQIMALRVEEALEGGGGASSHGGGGASGTR